MFLAEKGKHFGVLHTTSGGHPLDISHPIPAGSTSRIGMIYIPIQDDGYGLKPPVRVCWKSRNNVSMIHTPAIFECKILSNISIFQRGCRSQLIISLWVIIQVMDAEQERI